MEKWICKVCGYTHSGHVAPDQCPECGASRSQFQLQTNAKGCGSGILIVLIAIVIVIIALVSCSPQTADNTPVSKVDITRYLGKWYEIARFDHRFERNMSHCSATYTLQDNGRLKIMNQGKKNGKWKVSEGKGKFTDEPGVLRVSFFGPFYSDYRIMLLAPDYSYALIGGSNDNYLWILSRTPQLPKVTRDRIIREANRRGYNTDNLIWVEQHTPNTIMPH